jgi:indolepyruvate ferredoxin oxidoreductase
MAAHLERKSASVLDFMGFAQKGGAVLSFVRIAPTPDLLNQVRIDTQQADVLLACDLVVGASVDALHTVKPGRTVILANTHELPTAAFVRNPDASLHAAELLAKMRHAAGAQGTLRTLDAQDIARSPARRHAASNIVMLGAAWQAGLVPVGHGGADARRSSSTAWRPRTNKTAFALGRLAWPRPRPASAWAARRAEPVQLFLQRDRLDGENGLIAAPHALSWPPTRTRRSPRRYRRARRSGCARRVEPAAARQRWC